uniref:BED-type domain-containing protein n=1 Tax=Chenopodium quinoa TaxID=63459 RepID=A0A803KSJ2_CHEQI
MTSKNENNASVPTSASNTPIALDDDDIPLETNSDPSLLPITSRHTSAVWSDFKRKRVGDVIKAECNHCSKLLAGGSKAGTTHLKDHIKICPKRVCQDLRQTRMFGTKKNLNDKNDTMTLAPYEFHQEDGRRDLAEMIILHEKDIMKRYELEKDNVATLLRKAKGKIALTTDMWTADNQRKGYMAVTSHFIDNTWKLQSRIIRFLYVPAPHTAEVLADALKESIQSWNLDLRLSSITVDNYGLSVVVSNGVQRIRDSVVFWTASDKRVQRFEQVAKQIAPECSRKLALDCKTRWNSTYEMLSIATSYKEVFVVLSARNNLYKNPPTPEDWEKVEKICEHLEVFSITTLNFSGTNYPTANLYFPRICALRIAISGWLLSPHDYVRKMADIMLQKYNKYWASVNGLMGVATILDPRYKMALIRFYFAKIFEEHDFEIEVGRISDLLRRLVDEYGSKMGKTQGSSNQQAFDLDSSSKSNEETFMQEFAEFLQQDKDSNCGDFKDDKYAKLVGELEEGFETCDIDSGTSGLCTE